MLQASYFFHETISFLFWYEGEMETDRQTGGHTERQADKNDASA